MLCFCLLLTKCCILGEKHCIALDPLHLVKKRSKFWQGKLGRCTVKERRNRKVRYRTKRKCFLSKTKNKNIFMFIVIKWFISLVRNFFFHFDSPDLPDLPWFLGHVTFFDQASATVDGTAVWAGSGEWNRMKTFNTLLLDCFSAEKVSWSCLKHGLTKQLPEVSMLWDEVEASNESQKFVKLVLLVTIVLCVPSETALSTLHGPTAQHSHVPS